MTNKNVNPDLLRLKDMLQAIDDIEDIAFKTNSSRRDLLATAYSIAIIGEAASALSKGLKEQHVQIPWRDIISMRHKIVHEYGKVEIPIVLAVVTDDIPLLKKQVMAILASLESKP